jgi:putative phosphoesterase
VAQPPAGFKASPPRIHADELDDSLQPAVWGYGVAMARPDDHRPVTVGLISDTHALLRNEALEALTGADFLVHAGDIGSADILERLGAIAPVTAVRGNNDVSAWAMEIPLLDTLVVGAVRIQVVHELAHLRGRTPAQGTRVVVHGHSHRPAIELRDGVLYVNPGSAGPRRFRLPVTVALMRIDGAEVDAEIVRLL